MCKIKKILYIILSCVFLLMTLFEIRINASERNLENIDIDIFYGNINDIKVNSYLPINLKIDNKDTSLKAKLNVEVYSYNTETHNYVYYLDIKENEVFNKDYTIYIEEETYLIKLSLENESLDIIFEKELILKDNYNRSNLVIGVLSDTPNKLKFFDDVSLNYGLLKTKLIELNAKTFPTENKKLEQLDVILISNYRIKDLSYEQSRALMDFVKNGGIMIMGTGLRADDTIGRYAPELLDEMYTEAYVKTLNFKDSDKNIIQKDIDIVDLEIHGGNEIISEDNTALVISVNKEKGKIIVSAFDFCQLYPELLSSSEYISNLLTKSIGLKFLEELTNKTSYENAYQYSRVKNLLSTPDFSRFPKLNIYFTLIFLYLILAFPLSFIVLKYYNLSSVYLRFICVSSLFFTIIIYILSSATRFKDTFYKYISINSVNEDYIARNIFVKMSNPYNKEYGFLLDNDYYYKPLDENFIYDNDKKDKVNIEQRDTDISVQYSKNKAFETHIFELEKREENTEEVSIDAYINVFKDEVNGYIQNNYKFDLIDVNIFLYSKLIHIGELKTGEKLSLDDKKIINIPLGSHFFIGSYLNPYYNIYNFETITKERVKEFERTDLMLFYMDNFSHSYTQDAKILAFAREEENTYIIKNLKGEGLSLYVNNVNVDNTKDEYIYRQALLKDPTIISGEYYSETNTYYTLAPLVLEYNLGNDVDIEELIFEYIDKSFEKESGLELFEGDIYLYNNITKTFDKKDKNKKVYDKQELESYLSFDNTIKIRYFNNNTDTMDMYNNLPLPMLSIVASRR